MNSMMAATLTVTEVAPDHRRYTLDCDHATTTVDWLVSPVAGVDEDVVIGVLRDRHAGTCSCGLYVRGGAA